MSNKKAKNFEKWRNSINNSTCLSDLKKKEEKMDERSKFKQYAQLASSLGGIFSVCKEEKDLGGTVDNRDKCFGGTFNNFVEFTEQAIQLQIKSPSLKKNVKRKATETDTSDENKKKKVEMLPTICIFVNNGKQCGNSTVYSKNALKSGQTKCKCGKHCKTTHCNK